MFWRRPENVLKTSWSCLEHVFARRLEDFLKTFWTRFCKTSWRRLENFLKTSWRRMTKTIMLVLIKTSWRRLLKTKTKDVFKTSSRRFHQDECLLGRIYCVQRHSSYWKANMSWVRDCIFFLIFYAVDVVKH